jgi:hypothetical protein
MTWIRPDWPAAASVNALVTTRAAGDMAPGGQGRLEVRKLVPAEPVWMQQVHGVAVINAQETGKMLRADASIARRANTVCAVLIADCMPVFLSDESGGAVAVAHAGWRGLCGGVLEASVTALGVPPGKLLAWLGPAIGPRVYEVGDEVREMFVAHDPRATSAFAASRPGHWLLDLYTVARQRLQEAGVASIHGGGFCTYSDAQRFFSFRRDRTTCRMAALIWLA